MFYYKTYFLLIALFHIFLFANTPIWFESKKITHTSTQLLGYGQAESFNEAKEIAKVKIAQMLQLNIDTTMTIEKNASVDGYDKKINQTIKTTTSVSLNGLRIIKQEKMDKHWFVAIVYDNLPLFQKIINFTYIQDIKKSNHPYLKKTKLFKYLKKYFGFYPKSIIYAQNGQYYISIAHRQFLISGQEFVELFFNSYDENIQIGLNESVKENESYFITTKFKTFGFASLFLVAENGTVVNLFKNIELNDAIFTYPNRKEYDGLKAKIEDGKKQNRDMFVALLCDKKEDIGLFNHISTTLEEDSFRFGDLVDLMGKCTFSTKILTIFRD